MMFNVVCLLGFHFINFSLSEIKLLLISCTLFEFVCQKLGTPPSCLNLIFNKILIDKNFLGFKQIIFNDDDDEDIILTT